MAQEQKPNIDHIKEALVSSGILKSANLSEAEQESIKKELAAKGVAVEHKVLCSWAHFCIVIPR